MGKHIKGRTRDEWVLSTVGIVFDSEQLLADLLALKESGMGVRKAFESLPVGKYVKLKKQREVASNAGSDAGGSADSRCLDRGPIVIDPLGVVTRAKTTFKREG